MKQALSLILVLALCLSVCACRRKENPEPTDTFPTAPGSADTPPIVIDGLLEGTDITVQKFLEYLEPVALTTENWKEHFKVYAYSYSYDEVKVDRDDFGEIVSTETITHTGNGYAFGAGNEKYHWYNNVVIELLNKKTGETVVYKLGPYEQANDISVEKDFNPDDYECTRIKGSIYYFSFPVGVLPLATYIWPQQQEGTALPPGALYVFPGTNAVSNTYMMDWMS